MFFGIGRRGIKTGIDLGNRLIKVVQARHTATELELVHRELVELPHCASQEEHLAQTVRALKELGRRSWFSRADLRVVFSFPSLYLRELHMPRMDPDELVSALPRHVEEYLPMSAAQARITPVPLDDGGNGGPMRVLAVVLPVEQVQQLIETLKSAGLEVERITLPPFAQAASFTANYGTDVDKTTALIDAGARSTFLTLIRNNRIQRIHRLPIGGEDITARLQSGLEIDHDQGERFKKEQGRPGAPDLDFATGPFIQEVQKEIEAAFLQYEYEHYQLTIDKILLSGGGAALHGMRQKLQAHLGVDVVHADPLGCFLDEDPEDTDRKLYMSAVGCLFN